MEKLKTWATKLKHNLVALYLVYKDKRLSWWVRIYTLCVVGYAFSPIDIIPDFIPIIGYLDDLIIVPIGIYFALKMIPKDIFEECLGKAKSMDRSDVPINWVAGLLVITVWVFVLLEIYQIFLQDNL